MRLFICMTGLVFMIEFCEVSKIPIAVSVALFCSVIVAATQDAREVLK